MNVLPLVLMLILMTAVITVEKLEKFKSTVIVQRQYQLYLEEDEREALNLHQRNLYAEYEPSQRQLSFTMFFNKKNREKNPEVFRQIRQITEDLIKVLYGQAAFYKKLESQRPNFVHEMLDDFMAAADKLNKINKIRQIEDIQRIRLEDPVLQQAFYHILKGTITKKKLKELQTKEGTDEKIALSQRNQEKGYYSLLNFIKHTEKPQIEIQLASRELLLAIFGNEEIVEAILIKRNEKSADIGAQFIEAFKGKQKPGISNELLNFKLTKTDKKPYD
ncbi:hypothetical protein [Candidatus Protochlamydia sp. R18]|uniref:hypothetical protein n=1 Tax=Candidatus Protochlamydia sp. R18 TaxID=1353977 RepID=UPI0005A65172|nr:hypothetical protein [Candidatus Protochlamydia sp. R18]